MSARRVLLGLVAVTVGVAFFLDRVGGVDVIIPELRRWWPVALLALGLANLVRAVPRPGAVLGPLAIILAGTFLLLVTFNVVEVGWDDYPLIWPAALAVAGYLVALTGADWPNRRLRYQNEFRRLVWLRDERVASRAEAFWRADVTVLLGSFELDLREARLHTRAVVNVTAIFGSVDVIVSPGVSICERRPFLLDRLGVMMERSPAAATANLTVHLLGLFGSARAWEAATQPKQPAREAAS